MADHQASRAAAASGNIKGRFEPFTRTNPAEEAASQPATQGGLGTTNSWIWGSSAIGGNALGGTFGTSSTRAPGEEPFLQTTGGAGVGEGKQGSSSLLPGSGEHTSWPTKPTVPGWAGTDATSPGITAVNINQDLSRSPVRMRNTNGKFESPKQGTEVPRSSSPFYGLGRQGVVGQSPNGKTIYEAPGNTFGEALTSNPSRGRPLEIGQFGTQRFGTTAAQTDSTERRLNPLTGGLETDESPLRRGRGLSNSRGIVPDLLNPSSAGRSESLPPQHRPTSTPPSSSHDPMAITNNGAFASYTYTPNTSQSTVTSGLHATTAFQSVVPNRYGDLSRDTREAEALAQFKQLSVEDEGESVFTRHNRAPYPSFGQNAPSVAYPPQPPFPEFPYQRHAPQGSHGSSVWGQDDTAYRPQDMEYSHEYYQEMNFARNGTISPGGQNGDYNRRSLGSPYYQEETPPSGMDNFRSSSRGPASRSHFQPEKLRQSLLATQQSQQVSYSSGMRDPMYRQSYTGGAYGYDIAYNGMRSQAQSWSGALSPPGGPSQPGSRRQEEFSGLRSVLLEEFRSNSKSNKRYELKDIYGHVVEFSGDQHGSRFIQQKLETANSDEKEAVFQEIRPNSLQLMTDVFGNYVIQKFFEHGNQLQKSILAKQMEGHVESLSNQMYGCRVVQKALEHILTEQQARLVKELDAHVLKCVKDQNGNHVIQKAIERVPAEHVQFIIKAFDGEVHKLATHPYGCRVIQRMLEHCDEDAQASILKELHVSTHTLVQDQYGNYVTQHVIEHGKPEDRARIIKLVTANLLQFSKHKFASNVVEKSIAFGSPEQKREIVHVVTTPKADGTSPLHLLMRDQYGNYVIQKLLTLLNGEDRETLVEQIKPQLQALKKFTYGKQINAIEKLIFTNNNHAGPSTQAGPSTTQANSSPRSSSTATPPQSVQNSEVSSPQSTALSSTCGDAGSNEKGKGVAIDA